jgi:hypothetical protein
VDVGIPIVIVAWAPKDGDWDDSIDKVDDAFWPLTSQNHCLIHNRLAVWREDVGVPIENYRSIHWYYILPIAKISNASDVADLIVTPSLKLLEAPAQLDAIPDVAVDLTGFFHT